MNCAEKILESTIFFDLYTYTKSPKHFRFRKSLAQERFKSNSPVQINNHLFVESEQYFITDVKNSEKNHDQIDILF